MSEGGDKTEAGFQIYENAVGMIEIVRNYVTYLKAAEGNGEKVRVRFGQITKTDSADHHESRHLQRRVIISTQPLIAHSYSRAILPGRNVIFFFNKYTSFNSVAGLSQWMCFGATPKHN
jgi:hypothetical protein